MPPLTAAATPDECAAWLTENLPEAYAATASAAAREHGFDGAALFKLSEDDLGSKLGIVKIGLPSCLAGTCSVSPCKDSTKMRRDRRRGWGALPADDTPRPRRGWR